METIEAKKNIDYERQVVMFGKEKADTALQFYMLGSNNSEHNKANNPACLLGAVISRFSSQNKMKILKEILKDHCDNKWGILLIICITVVIICALSLIGIAIAMLV